MKRLWWGLLGVAVLATSTGCRHTCGESRCGKLFARDHCDAAPTRLASVSKDACSVTPLGYPTGGPVYGPLPSGAVPTVPPANVETIPPTFVPATPTPAIPPGSAKNILPPPLELTPPAAVVGLPK